MTTYARGKKWAEAGEEVNERRNAQPEDRQFQLAADFGMTGDHPAPSQGWRKASRRECLGRA